MKNLDDRSRDKDGQIRRKRSDTKIETLKKDYPEFRKENGNKHLGTLEEELGTDSLDATRKALREKQK
jgi:hypothetical protein